MKMNMPIIGTGNAKSIHKSRENGGTEQASYLKACVMNSAIAA